MAEALPEGRPHAARPRPREGAGRIGGSAPERHPGREVRETAEHGARDGRILRFERSERLIHWAIAAPFTVCYLTALVLVVIYNPNPRLPYRLVFSWTHRISGTCMIVLPLLTAITHPRDALIHLGNIRRVWSWSLADIRWLLLTGPATFDKRIELPHQGKFNAGEKLNFMVLSATYPVYIATGIMIWMPGVAWASWMVHVSMATLATPLLFGHIFMATVNPDTRPGLPGVFTGYVDRNWASHHYTLWFRERYRDDGGHAPAGVEDHAPPPLPVEILCPSCRTASAPVPASALVDGLSRRDSLSCPRCGAAPERVSALIEEEDLEPVLRRLAWGAGWGSIAREPKPARRGGDLLGASPEDFPGRLDASPAGGGSA